MKTVLCALNARYSHSSLALLYLKKYCDKFDMEIAEFSTNDTPHAIYSDLVEIKADIYAFSCYIWNISQTAVVADMIKTSMPECIIVFGGPQAQGDFDFVDHFVSGEGEKPFFALLTALENGELPPKLLKSEENLSPFEIPAPYTKEDIISRRGKIIYFETSRGCPFSCAYCLSSTDRRVRYLPMDYVRKNLLLLFENEVPLVKLVDRTFNCDIERAAQIIEFISENSISTRVHFEMAPHLINDDIIGLLAQKPHLFRVEIGIQSANPKTLAAVNRNFDLEAVAKIIERIKKTGVCVHLDLIAGLPFEDYASFARSFDFAYAFRPDMLQLGFLKALPDTPIREMNGICYMKTPPFEVLRTDWLSASELIRLKKTEEAVDRFYNSRAFSRTIEVLTKKNAFSVFEALGRALKTAESKGKIPRFRLGDILYEFGGESVLVPLALDLLQSFRERPLPKYIKRNEPDDYKKRCAEYLKRHNFSLKNVRIEPIFDKVYLADYESNTVSDITDEI
ncbi:MAG: coproporphyrinogen III oxidase [Firmicutes bacterium ADurb.Bin193]|nr:MAG: coproporphyrinogen III oxidase [Firmicutes bacterium ADurb.Bin193]